jgi:predicted Zn-ribbon and HTH transcriptional regulator
MQPNTARLRMVTRVDTRHISEYRHCSRCGYRYRPRKTSPALCPDCRYTMSEEEVRTWTS